jgi:hypothetical protein
LYHGGAEKKRKNCFESPFYGTVSAVCLDQKTKGGFPMRGYFTASGYYGLVDGRYCLFASEADYYEAVAEDAA